MDLPGIQEMTKFVSRAATGLLLALPLVAAAQGAPASLPLLVGQGGGGTSYSVPIQTLLFFTALSFLPAIALGSILWQSFALAFVYGGDAKTAFFLTKLASRSIQFGVTFVNCNTAIYYSRDFDYEAWYQSCDRIYRKGQVNQCTYLSIVAEGTIDEDIERALSRKGTAADVMESLINRVR